MKKFIIVMCVSALCVMMACQDEEHIKMKGNIVGFVKLLDENGLEVADRSNVTILLDESTSVKTDAAGRFEFQGIEPGTFKVRFEKEGFGAMERFNFIFVGGAKPAVISNVTLVALPSFELLSKTVNVSGDWVSIDGTMNEVNEYHFIYFFSDKAEVSNTNYKYSSGYSACCGPMSSFSNSFYIPSNLTGTVYMTMYAISKGNTNGLHSYYDFEKDSYVNPASKKLFDPVKLR